MRDVLEDDDDRKLSPTAIVISLATTVVSGLILFNAFFGQAQSLSRSNTLLSGDFPDGASTRVDVVLPGNTGSTITLKYDPEVEQVQRELLAAGYFKGTVDGVMGKKTRLAIEQYQQSLNIAVTGEASRELVEHIRYTRQVSAAAEFTGSIAKPEVDVSDDQQRIGIEKVQMSLASIGYDPGPIDGVLSEETRGAILKFSMDRSLPMDGEITPELLAELAKSSDQEELPVE